MYNNVSDKNKYLLLKCWLKRDDLLRIENIDNIFINGGTKNYEQIVIELKKSFLAASDQISLRREINCNQQTAFQNTSKFFFPKFELKNKLGLDFEEHIKILLPLFHAAYSGAF